MIGRLILLLFVTLATVAALPARAQSDVPSTADLTEQSRKSLDQLALRTPSEKLPEKHVDLFGAGVAWLVTQVSITPADEQRLARDERFELIKKHLRDLRKVDRDVDQIFKKLVEQLPERFKPFAYRLTILDLPTPESFNYGGGEVIVTQSLLERLGKGGRGKEAIAWMLAHEIGHVARGHSRRGYQLKKAQKELDGYLANKKNKNLVERALQTSIAPVGQMVPFLYTREQEHEADLFAFHLCRNAGFDRDAVLDGARWLVTVQYPNALTDPDFATGKAVETNWMKHYLARHPSSLHRLKRLLMEKDGLVENATQFGIFRWDRNRKEYTRCTDGSLQKVRRAIVFVHGLYGDDRSFEKFHEHFDAQPKLRDRPTFLFRYPNNGSLARMGLFLKREMDRTKLDGREAFFIAHSAGGLGLRHYAEKAGGQFGRAVLLGTPHKGSNITALKAIVDVSEVVVALKRFGWFESIAKTMRETQGVIRYDLQPDSLFLRDLGHNNSLAGRYDVVYGRYFQGKRGTAMKIGLIAAVNAGKDYVKKTWIPKLGFAPLESYANQVADKIHLPREVLLGDLIVTTESARLDGAHSFKQLQLHHQSLKTDESAIRYVAELVSRSR